MSGITTRFLHVLCLVVCVLASTLFAGEGTESKSKRSKRQPNLRMISTPWGPSQADVDAAKARVEASSELRAAVAGTKYRMISFEYLDSAQKLGPTPPPSRFQIIYYNYTHDRTLVAVGDFAGKEAITVREETFQPVASPEEFAEAVEILKGDAGFASWMRSGKVRTFEPMPDVTVLQGTVERLINVGIDAGSERTGHEIVSISLLQRKVIRYPEGAPLTSVADPESCGIANSGQGATGRGIAGQATLTVMDGTNTLWEMLLIRPSASTGTRASGLEIRDVKYRGKSVLKRGHAPILNVQYTPQTCGPYRDWQYAEGFFNAPPTGAQNPAPGIRILAAGQVATTSVETANDTGDFQGVAAYAQDNEVVVVTEMNADWYRYIMEWRFASDGTIRPRFGFGAVKNSCVCNSHKHHVFWRLDFDVVQPNNKVFRVERGRKYLTPLATEMKQPKNNATNRGLLIQNSAGNEAYMLAPNVFDGAVDVFGVSDMWVLRYRTSAGTPFQQELDDGFNQTTSQNAFIQIDQFLNNETLTDQDVVVWYGSHFLHNDGANLMNPDRSPERLTGTHVVGPDIRPVRW